MVRNKPIKVCYILSYYSPDYVRTQTLVEGLARIEAVTVYQARNRSTSIFRYFETLMKLLAVRMKYNPDCYILGFRGYEIYWPVRLITLGKRLILDHLVSPFDSLLNERKKIRQGSYLARLIGFYEKWMLKNADAILADTVKHQEHFVSTFQIDANKIYVIPVSTNEDLFKPQCKKYSDPKNTFQVFFYGTFLPLHGIDIVVQAASYLSDLPIEFMLVGGRGKDIAFFHHMVAELKLNNVHHRAWIDYNKLPGVISSADLCLGGPFGNTGQAGRVITGKTYQFLSMAKPTVIGQIDEETGFEDKENCLLIEQGNAKALAEAIRWGFEHQPELESIGKRGHQLYLNKFSIDKVSGMLQEMLFP
ncbi:MAG: glycosyltransferase [Anaerolineae bacterium]|nr:glycosyltransferase [Anaerolineae bacterium]